MAASACSLKPLNAIYHSALRFIPSANCSTHHCSLQPSWVEDPTSIWFFAILRPSLANFQLASLDYLFIQHMSVFNTTLKQLVTITKPEFHIELRRTAFSVHVPHIWNNIHLPFKLNSLISLSQFHHFFLFSLKNIFYFHVLFCFY